MAGYGGMKPAENQGFWGERREKGKICDDVPATVKTGKFGLRDS
jgi:hypothetical protein